MQRKRYILKDLRGCSCQIQITVSARKVFTAIAGGKNAAKYGVNHAELKTCNPLNFKV